MERKCDNIRCQNTYQTNDSEGDDGFCCFECWEEVNCLAPIKIKFEEIMDY